MIICKECGVKVYIQQRVEPLIYHPYYCVVCEEFKSYDEVTYKK